MIKLGLRELRRRARQLELLVLDVDGVLTSGELLLIEGEQEAKRFHFHDGLGVILLRSAGVRVAIMSDRRSAALERRAAELGIEEICPVLSGDKEASLESLLRKTGLEPLQVGYVGDDLRDVPPMKRVGLPIAVANGRPQVKEYSVYVTRTAGGDGAVREVAEWLLDLRGQKEAAMAPFVLTAEERSQGQMAGGADSAADNKLLRRVLRFLLFRTQAGIRRAGSGVSLDQNPAQR